MGYGPNTVYFIDNSLMTILLLAIRLLWITFIFAIVKGLIVEAQGRRWDKLGSSLVQQINGYHQPKTKYCTACGQHLVSEWQYCPSCSTRVKSESCIGKIEVASENKIEVISESKIEVASESEINEEPEREPVSCLEVASEMEASSNNNKSQETNDNDNVQKSRKRKKTNNRKANSNV